MSLKAAIAFASRDVTQMHLQDVSGVNQGRLSKIFNSDRIERPSLREIVAVEDALGLERGFILALAGYASAEGAAQAEAALAAARPGSRSRAGKSTKSAKSKSAKSRAARSGARGAAPRATKSAGQLRAASGGKTSGRRRRGGPRPRGAAPEAGV